MLILRLSVTTLFYGEFLALGSAISWACAIIVIKVLSCTETSVTITTYMYVLMPPAVLIAAFFCCTWPTLKQYCRSVVIALTGALGHVLTAEALSCGDTHVITLFDFFHLIWPTLIGILLFGESVNNLVWIGGAVVITSVS